MTKEELRYYKELVAVIVDDKEVITSVHWRYCATDGTLIGKYYQTTPVVNQGVFIPYSELDANTILSWVMDADAEDTWKEKSYLEYLNILPNISTPETTLENKDVRSWV